LRCKSLLNHPDAPTHPRQNGDARHLWTGS